MAALNELVFENFSVSDKTNTLNAQLWNGAIGFTVFSKDRSGGGGPLLRINLDRKGHGYVKIMEVISELEKSPLGKKIPISKTEWDPQTRQRKNVWVISLEKDAEMVYKITLTDCRTNASFTFPITSSQSIISGSEPPNKAILSATGMNMFKAWLQQAHMYAPLTANKPQFNKGGGQRPAGGPTPSSAAVAPQVASDPDNAPF